MGHTVESKHFIIDAVTLPWIDVHCRFIPQDALIEIIKSEHGVSDAMKSGQDKYCITVFYGKAFDPEQIAYAVARKVERYIKQN